MIEGAIERLSPTPGAPARYELTLAGPAAEVISRPLNTFVGSELQIVFQGVITCRACGAATRRSFADGHCYPCFKRLARCDLCVVSPARCHYAAGTCREPDWGEAFCMQPHLVYLANSSGPKVGITSGESAVGRWLDQGASQGLVVARAATRHLAGVLEERLAARIPDRTDWRLLVTRDPPAEDLGALREALRPAADELPDGVAWLDDEPEQALSYPVLRYPRQPIQLDLQRQGRVRGLLVGIKGQYLLFEHAVLNVRRHAGCHVALAPVDEWAPHERAEPAPRISQMELFPE